MVSVISGRLDLRFALFAGRKSIRLFPPSPLHYLEAGGGLFIPAGWFHEVTSSAADGNEEQHGSCAVTNCSYGLERSLHAAVNFWFAPPSAT